VGAQGGPSGGAGALPRRAREGGAHGSRRGARKGRVGAARGARREATRGKKKGRVRGRERGRGEGSSPWGPTPAITVSKTLGTTGRERDGRERERLMRGRNQMREKGPGARMRSRGARGARAELGRVRLGWAITRTAGQNPMARTTIDRKSIREAKIQNKSKQRTRLSTKSDKEI
jgi:hypothetical protein